MNTHAMDEFADHRVVVRLFYGDLGACSRRAEVLVRCNLNQANSPVEVNYCEGSGWQPTQYQCADASHCTDASHRTDNLIKLGEVLAAAAADVPAEEFECDHELWVKGESWQRL